MEKTEKMENQVVEPAEEHYKLTKKDIRGIYFRNMTMEASWSYERMQGPGVLAVLAPVLAKIYKNSPEKLKQALLRHTEFFNTGPTYGAYTIFGIVIALEEGQVDPELIRGMKTGMMGPMAAIDDTLKYGILQPLLFSIPASMALVKGGNIMSAFIALIIVQLALFIWGPFISWKLLNLGYTQGASLATSSQEILDKVNFGAGVVGLTVVGALGASILNVTSTFTHSFGGYKFDLQVLLDTLFPKLLPLLTVLGVLYLIRARKMSPVKIIGIIFLVFIILGGLGILG